MSKYYKVFSRTLTMGTRKGETVYSVRPVSNGTLTTDQVAKQISTESTATTADVKAVLDRYAYYVMDNLAKGYNIELLGFGTLYIRFITNRSVTDPKKAKSNLVKNIVPAFRPSFTVDRNGKRTYDLIPNRISLVKYGEDSTSDGTGDGGDEDDNSTPTPTPTPSDKGDSTGGGSGSGNAGTGDSGSGTGGDDNGGIGDND